MPSTVYTPQSFCRFGVARAEITPPVGIYHRMWGAASHERATGIHRPLTATALVFQSAEADSAHAPGACQVLLAVDHCLLWAGEMDALLSKVAAASGLDRGQLVVAFSHTHSGGLLGLERAALPGGELIGPYLEQLAQSLGGLVREACASAQPANIVYGYGRCTMAAHRDYWDEQSNQFVCGFNPEGPADDTVLVARANAADGRLLATMVNYACHPTTLAWQNTLISPDYAGALREVVERELAAPCAFVQGASGDIGPREGFVGETSVADRNGRQLGFAALAALESLPPPATRFVYTGPVVSGATLGTWAHQPLTADERSRASGWQVRRWTINLPRRPGLANADETLAERESWREREAQASQADEIRDCRAMIERLDRRLVRIAAMPPGDTFPCPVTLWRMGDACWLAVEGEAYNILQRSLRKCFAGMPLVVATLANGSRPAYMPPAETYGRGIYQESIAMLAPGTLEQLIDAIAEQLSSWCGTVAN